MIELFNIGLTEKDIKTMYETNPEIKDLEDEDVKKLIFILKELECNERMIRNIITSNPFYLNRMDTDIIKLINKLSSIGLTSLNLLFDSNPYLLNKDDFEIDEFINKKINNYSLEDIVDMIDNNPYIIDEEE